MQYTLLQMTQTILSALNSDEVNSIGDTTESLQVAECIRTSYFNMLGRYDLPEHNQLINLSSNNNPTMPTLMFKPPGVNRIEWIKYFNSNVLDGGTLQSDQFGAYSHDLNLDLVPQNPWSTTSTTTATIGTGNFTFTVAQTSTLNIFIGQSVQVVNSVTNVMNGTVLSFTSTTITVNITSFTGAGTFSSWTLNGTGGFIQAAPGYEHIRILDVEHFIDHVSHFNLTESDVGSYTLIIDQNTSGLPGTFTVNYKNSSQPRYCCIIANLYILFDSYDSTQDSTLQPSKSMAYAWVMPAFQMTDTFTPPLDDQQYPMLLNEAKSLAFLELKQMPHSKAEQEVNRQLASLQKFKALANKPTPFQMLPNFGRRIGTGGYAVGYPNYPI
jgi:hypothetical protein